MKASTKNLLMAAVGIIQHAQEINSATGTAAINGEQVNYDDVCGRLCADLDDKVGQKITFHIRFLLWKLSLVVFVARF